MRGGSCFHLTEFIVKHKEQFLLDVQIFQKSPDLRNCAASSDCLNSV